MRITITMDPRTERRFLIIRAKMGFDFAPAAVVAKAFLLDGIEANEKWAAKKKGKS